MSPETTLKKFLYPYFIVTRNLAILPEWLALVSHMPSDTSLLPRLLPRPRLFKFSRCAHKTPIVQAFIPSFQLLHQAIKIPYTTH